MKIILCFLIALFAGSANAALINGFTGPYDLSNWTVTTAGDVTVNSTSPSSLEFGIHSPNVDYAAGQFGGGSARYEIVAAATGLVSFDAAVTSDHFAGTGPSILSFSSFPDGSPFSLESDLFQIGPIHIEMMVNSGETFGFQFFAGLNNALVRYQVYVSNFSAPVPEPHILLLIGLGLILLLGFSPANSFRLVKC
ncbi:hypothetical protein [Nitrosomonas sp.]|uniref:hypothetical protein n=1 Tax=Nitrosomonas sp. TaxID=42353 RepID=UPI00284ED37A|nr:hypothetical protein [Nitrosomonas sp.]MDR4515296.1 hypothetical protein [Nitrosomonas sp.]